MSEPPAPPRPLSGRRIVVTRARSQASSLVTALQDLGAEVIEIPTIETVPLESYEALDTALKKIANYQWLIVTSANTVRVIAERLVALNLPPSALSSLRKVAIGSATARAMREQGIEVDVIPEQYIAESLVTAMETFAASYKTNRCRSDDSANADDPPKGCHSGDSGNECHSDDQREEESRRSASDNDTNTSLPQSPPALNGRRVLLARATIARDVIPAELTRRGAIVDIVEAYKTVVPAGSIEQINQAFSDPANQPDAITFTSSSTVKNFFALWKEAGFSGVPVGVAAISIGPITSETLSELGWGPAGEAKPHDVEGLVVALSQAL